MNKRVISASKVTQRRKCRKVPTTGCQGEGVEYEPEGHLSQVVGMPAHTEQARRRETKAKTVDRILSNCFFFFRTTTIKSKLSLSEQTKNILIYLKTNLVIVSSLNLFTFSEIFFKLLESFYLVSVLSVLV